MYLFLGTVIAGILMLFSGIKIVGTLCLILSGWIFWKYLSPANIVRTSAEEIARAQLVCYQMVKNSNPMLEGESLYVNVLVRRPGYNEELAIEIARAAKKASSERGEPFSFLAFVIMAVTYEIDNSIGNNGPLSPDALGRIVEGVSKVIPKSL